MGVEESKVVKGVMENLAESTKTSYITTLNRFVNDFVKTMTIDELIEEAKTDVKKTQQRIDDFYKWLQTKRIERGEEREPLKESSAYIIAYGYLRGFFANLDVAFERKWKKRIPKAPSVRETLVKDKTYTFFDVDERTKTIRFNRERMQQFLSNLKLRDVAITLALLSSSQDSGDLFKLNVGYVRQQKNTRIFWEGNRQKTKVLFRTFFSKEATRFIRRYIEQERRDAKDDEPLFVFTTRRKGQTKPTEERMTPNYFGSVLRDTARKMGIKWENGERNPLRPKRMRHLFRTACDVAGIDEIYKNAFMGHKNNQGQDYSEIPRTVLELQYLRVEPFITVYGVAEEALEIREDVRKLENRIADLNRKIEEQNRVIADMSNLLERKVEQITRELWEEEFKADREAIKDLKKWREEYMRRQGKGSS